jgi:hypothetical protein
MKIPYNLDIIFRWLTGIGDAGIAPIKVEFTEGVWTPPSNFNVMCLTCTAGNTITVDWDDGNGNTVSDLVLPAEKVLRVFNIKNIKETGTDAVNLYAWPAIFN